MAHTLNNASDQSELMNFYCYVKTRKFVNTVASSLFSVCYSLLLSVLLLGCHATNQKQQSFHYTFFPVHQTNKRSPAAFQIVTDKKRMCMCQLVIRSVYYFDSRVNLWTNHSLCGSPSFFAICLLFSPQCIIFTTTNTNDCFARVGAIIVNTRESMEQIRIDICLDFATF